MLLVGLTGGYATGKSFAAKHFERLGCRLIYADKLGHLVLQKEGAAYADTLKTFGIGILGEDGSIDRKKLATIVFASPELLEKLTSLVHPAVYRLEEQIIGRWRQETPDAVAMVEAAILIESGRHPVFDRLILTNCAEETQVGRGMLRDGLTKQQALARMDRQMPFEQKAGKAHFVIDTNGTKEETVRQVETVFAELLALSIDGNR